MNGYAELFVKTIKAECLNHFTAMNYDHLMYLLKEYVDGHYNLIRPHRGLGNRPIGLPVPTECSANFSRDDVACDTHFRRNPQELLQEKCRVNTRPLQVDGNCLSCISNTIHR